MEIVRSLNFFEAHCNFEHIKIPFWVIQVPNLGIIMVPRLS